MKTKQKSFGRRALSLLGAVAISAFALQSHAAPANGYQVTNIVSDLAGVATNLDSSLLNPWGFVFDPNTNLIIADNGADLATFYGADGSVIPFSINVPTTPSGMEYNLSLTDFLIGPSTNPQPAQLLFCTEAGTIQGFTLAVDFNTTELAVDDSASGAVYKGMTLAKVFGKQYLYVTDFHNNLVKVYDHNFHLAGSFTDPQVPAGYAPFNIRSLGSFLYVTFAKQKLPDAHDDEAGPGNGFVDIFTPGGTLVRRLVKHDHLNSPWGLALAPSNFGKFSGALLVGNFGDGTINAYDAFTGYPLGHLTDAAGNTIVIPGLWSIKFLPAVQKNQHGRDFRGDDEGDDDDDRNGGNASLYFTAGPNGEADGVVGIITPATKRHHVVRHADY